MELPSRPGSIRSEDSRDLLGMQAAEPRALEFGVGQG